VCQTGWYGIKCDKKCGRCSRTFPNCQLTTGDCQECEYGWRGDNCDQPSVSTVAVSTTKDTGTLFFKISKDKNAIHRKQHLPSIF